MSFAKHLDDVFGTRAAIPLKEAADVLQIGRTTLHCLINDREITYIVRGAGRKRPRRWFTKSDLLDYHNRTRAQCQSTVQPERNSTATTSNVIPFDIPASPTVPGVRTLNVSKRN